VSDDVASHAGRLEHSSAALARDLARLPLVTALPVAPAAAVVLAVWMLSGRDQDLVGAVAELLPLLLVCACWTALSPIVVIADDRAGRFDVHEHALVCYTSPAGTSRRRWLIAKPLAARHCEVIGWSEILTVGIQRGEPNSTCRILLRSRRVISFEITTRRRSETASIVRSRITRLHSTGGPAWRWPDGTSLWALDGVEVPEWAVAAPSLSRIMDELATPEQRRAALARHGWDRVIANLRLEPIDQHPDPTVGTLYRLPASLSDDPVGMNLLVVRNASPNPDRTYTFYGLTAPPSARTVERAQAALMRLTVRQYRAIQVHT
jgi:hypothetical protein